MNEKRYWSDKAKAQTPYTPGEQLNKSVIKLNTNENAYPPSPAVLKGIETQAGKLRLYPTADAEEFIIAAAEFNGLEPENVFCGNGSDEVLALAFMALFNPGVPVKTYDVTYSFYKVWANLFDVTLDPVKLNDDFTPPLDKMKHANAVIIANPNAPTSIALDLYALEEIIKTASGPVIIDEAYFGFGAPTAADLISEYSNLLVVRTLSKSLSLAGLRVGYALGHKDLINALNTIKNCFNSYPVDRLAAAGGAAALRDKEYFEQTSLKIIKTREKTLEELTKMGLTVLPSSANFIFVKIPDTKEVFDKLRKNDILVRYFPEGRTNEYLRVSIGTEEDMQTFIETMRGII